MLSDLEGGGGAGRNISVLTLPFEIHSYGSCHLSGLSTCHSPGKWPPSVKQKQNPFHKNFLWQKHSHRQGTDKSYSGGPQPGPRSGPHTFSTAAETQQRALWPRPPMGTGTLLGVKSSDSAWPRGCPGSRKLLSPMWDQRTGLQPMSQHGGRSPVHRPRLVCASLRDFVTPETCMKFPFWCPVTPSHLLTHCPGAAFSSRGCPSSCMGPRASPSDPEGSLPPLFLVLCPQIVIPRSKQPGARGSTGGVKAGTFLAQTAVEEGQEAPYSHDGPAQVVGSAAPVHGVVQDVKREAGHSGLLEDPEVVACG